MRYQGNSLALGLMATAAPGSYDVFEVPYDVSSGCSGNCSEVAVGGETLQGAFEKFRTKRKVIGPNVIFEKNYSSRFASDLQSMLFI